MLLQHWIWIFSLNCNSIQEQRERKLEVVGKPARMPLSRTHARTDRRTTRQRNASGLIYSITRTKCTTTNSMRARLKPSAQTNRKPNGSWRRTYLVPRPRRWTVLCLRCLAVSRSSGFRRPMPGLWPRSRRLGLDAASKSPDFLGLASVWWIGASASASARKASCTSLCYIVGSWAARSPVCPLILAYEIPCFFPFAKTVCVSVRKNSVDVSKDRKWPLPR